MYLFYQTPPKLEPLKYLSLVFFLLAPRWSAAFPENTRYGYFHCTACHISPSGGGVLTAYGRGVSAEKMSTWSHGREPEFGHGFLTLPEWLQLGGDVRTVYTYRSNRALGYCKLEYFFMQGDLEGAAHWKNFTAVSTLGVQSPLSANLDGALLFARRAYLMYQPTENWNFRLGKFMANYGINTPNHFLYIKRNLSFDEGSETWNAEASYHTDSMELTATGIFGRPDAPAASPARTLESGAQLRGAFALGKQSQAGLTYSYGIGSAFTRHLAGPFLMWGILDRAYLLLEADFQYQMPTPTFGWVGYSRFGYELTQGVYFLLMTQLSRLDISTTAAEKEGYGVGFHFLLRPHWEIELMMLRDRDRGRSEMFGDFAWGLFHYYF